MSFPFKRGRQIIKTFPAYERRSLVDNAEDDGAISSDEGEYGSDEDIMTDDDDLYMSEAASNIRVMNPTLRPMRTFPPEDRLVIVGIYCEWADGRVIDV